MRERESRYLIIVWSFDENTMSAWIKQVPIDTLITRCLVSSPKWHPSRSCQLSRPFSYLKKNYFYEFANRNTFIKICQIKLTDRPNWANRRIDRSVLIKTLVTIKNYDKSLINWRQTTPPCRTWNSVQTRAPLGRCHNDDIIGWCKSISFSVASILLHAATCSQLDMISVRESITCVWRTHSTST